MLAFHSNRANRKRDLEDCIGLTLKPQRILHSANTKNNNGNGVITTASTNLAFKDYYIVTKKISEGNFGVVHKTEHIRTGSIYAVKIIERGGETEEARISAEGEIGILRDCRDMDKVVKLIDFYVTPERYYIVQTLAAGKDVFNRLKKREIYTEKNARDLARQLLEAVSVLHSRKICHRDLKPANILLLEKFSDNNIVVADFGFAKTVSIDKLKTQCGTPAFVAPEIFAAPGRRYDERVDNWSVGCLLYMLLCGGPPFQSDREEVIRRYDYRNEISRKICSGDYVMDEVQWGAVSVHAKNLISELLIVNPTNRLQAKDALRHAWLTVDDDLLQANDLSTTAEGIRNYFTIRRRLNHGIIFIQEPILSGMRRPSSLVFGDVYEQGGALPSNLIEGFEESESFQLFECRHRKTGIVYEVTLVSKSETTKLEMTYRTPADTMLYEASILDALNHSNVMKIHHFFEDDEKYYLVSDRIRGQDLYQQIDEKQIYTEDETKIVAHQLLSAVAHCHSKGIVHRNLKPQSILFVNEDTPAKIKLSGFGLACRIYEPRSLTKLVCTLLYAAPELLKNIPYGHAVDCWSVGVILFMMLVGQLPFNVDTSDDENLDELCRIIRIGDLGPGQDKTKWDTLSCHAKEMLKGLLDINPKTRLTASEALECSWFTDGKNDISLSIRGKIKSVGYYNKSIRNGRIGSNDECAQSTMSSLQSMKKMFFCCLEEQE